MRLRAHGLTILFWAGVVVTAVVGNASFELADFDDRVVSGATLHMVDVGARTHLYALGLASLVVSAIVLAVLMPWIARFVGDDALSDLEDASLVGIVVLFMAGLTSVENDAVALVAWLEVAWLGCAGLEARAFGRRLHPQRGSVFLLLAVSAYALVCATSWRTSAPVVAALTVALHVALQRLPRAASVDRALRALSVLALLPLALVVREEVRLWANARDVTAIGDTSATVIVVLSILAIALVRARLVDAHERVDAARLVARTSLPCLLVGLSTLTFWTAVKIPPNEMFEAGNAGLSIQQWFDFGRWPFFDTFDVHGLSDSLMGFLYACVNGWNGVGWQLWDFVPYALAALAVYALLARVLHSAPFAFAIVAVSPLVRELFPSAFAIVIPCAFAVIACLRARRALAFVWMALALAFVWLWRMDLAFACTIACAVTLAVRVIAERGERFPWKRALAGVGSCLLALVLVVGLLSAWRGVDLAGRARELSRVLDSNQAWGGARIADRLDEVVSFRVFVMPAVLVFIVVWLVARARARGAPGARVSWGTYALSFLAAVTLVLSTRGLVRHTFVEHVSAYVTGFGFAVVALVPAVILAPDRRRLAFTGFVVLHALLPLAFDIENHTAGNSEDLRSNVLARASYRLRAWTPVNLEGGRYERSGVSPAFRAGNIEPMRALMSDCLASNETFVDLSASPMLYVYAGARSPHWLNHVLAVQGDFLQKRFMSELDRSSAPLLVMGQDPSLMVRDGVPGILDLDGVPLPLWHARLFDALFARSEPFTMAGRYEVWSRMDWAPPTYPHPEGESLGTIAIGAQNGSAFEARDGEILVLRASSRSSAGGVLHVSARVAVNGFEDVVTRDVVWPATARHRELPILGEGHGVRLTGVAVHASDGLDLEPLDVRRVRDPESANVAVRAALAVDSELGPTARLWGKYDSASRTTVATLHDRAAAPILVPDGARSRFPFTALSRMERSVLVVCDVDSDATSRVGVVVHYGVNELESGSYRFDVDMGPGPANYVFRPGFQANWHRRPNSWLEIETQGGSVRVRSLELAREP